MKIFAETDRLILREILPTDIDRMFALDSDPEVHKYLGSEPVKNRNQTIDMISFIRQQYVDYGIGRWAIIDKNTTTFIGWAGIKFVTELTNGHKDYYDLGYRLIKEYWGNGIATEAASASLNYAFEKLNTTKIYAIADVKNTNSNKILKKIGFTLIEQFDLDGVEHNWYNIGKKEHRKKLSIR